MAREQAEKVRGEGESYMESRVRAYLFVLQSPAKTGLSSQN